LSAADGLHAVIASSTPVIHRPAVVRTSLRHSLSLSLQVAATQASCRASSSTAAVGAPSCHWPPRVFIRRRRLILELHHDALVPSSPTTGATCRSSGLAPVSPSAEPPPPLRALSGEPLLPDVPQTSPPPHRVSLVAVPDPPRRWQTPKSGQPPPPNSWRHGHPPAPWWAVSPGRRPTVAVGCSAGSRGSFTTGLPWALLRGGLS
jgi:hypothetical protein